MSLQDVNIKPEYRSLMDNIASDFIVPALSESKKYCRAVGFFSSSALLEISKGIGPFVSNGGRMQLIASPHLSEDDIDAISRGYKSRDAVIKESLISELSSPEDEDERNRLNLLANLIASGVLDIKIAFTEHDNAIGIYHEKVGLLFDADRNVVAFAGSMNESLTALTKNYETVDVFCSWDDPQGRVSLKRAGFAAIWEDYEPNIRSYSFPELDEEIIRRYLREKPDFNIDKEMLATEKNLDSLDLRENTYPQVPKGFDFRSYQDEAIDSWEEHGFRGIFDMATGTGKTKTSLGALTKLSTLLQHELAVVIVCPYQHLVEQWVEDITYFNMEPIIGYSDSPQRNWFEQLKTHIRDQRYGVPGSEFLCFVCTNGTFSTERVQDQLKRINTRKLLIVDEAHNFGAEYLRFLLDESFDYRLALSATIERHGDQVGTESLYSYFGDRCISYTLEEAIYGRDGEPPRLTPYKYYPVIVTLDDDELSQYVDLTRKISRCIMQKNGKKCLSIQGKTIAMQRARLVAGAKAKINGLMKQIDPYKNDNFILVYCGAAKTVGSDSSNDESENNEERQIEIVTKKLGNDLRMKVHQFTSQESRKQREEIKERFKTGQGLQALVAIKCLDEGVDIPSIKTAFILASTTNPREYIQRRGRLLRQAEGKDYAEIYDFLTLPRNLGDTTSLTKEEMSGDLRLVYNELVRAKEFASLAMNAATASAMLSEIEETYFGINGIDAYGDMKEYEE